MTLPSRNHGPANRRAKILITLGPATADETILERLIAAGINGVRLNFSHGTREQHAELHQTTRRLAKEAGLPLAIVQDLQGPRLRTSRHESGGTLLLADGQRVSLSIIPGRSTAEVIHVDYRALVNDVSIGDRILIDDGRIELQVIATSENQVEAEVLTGGNLGERKGINLPGVAISAPSPTDKDLEDLAFGLELGMDMVAVSFVRRPEEIERVSLALESGTENALPPYLIGKLERQEAIDNLDSILQASYGVMVARGDLGVELAPERVPSLQKQIITSANRQSRLVITATQMLESMVRNPRPTRAEASDVANAVFDGSDVLMLSGETAIGEYPLAAVNTMDRIIRDAEAHAIEWGAVADRTRRTLVDDAAATTQAARDLAHDRGARAVAVFTRSGRTALLTSKARPAMPIYGFTPETTTYNRMALMWGVSPQLIPMATSVEQMIEQMEETLVSRGDVIEGDRVVLVASLPIGAMGPANMSYLHTIGQPYTTHSN